MPFEKVAGGQVFRTEGFPIGSRDTGTQKQTIALPYTPSRHQIRLSNFITPSGKHLNIYSSGCNWPVVPLFETSFCEVQPRLPVENVKLTPLFRTV